MGEQVFEAPGIVITRRCVLGKGDDLTFQAGIDQTCGEGDLNELLDRLNRCADRQRAIAELPEKQQALEVARALPGQMDEEVTRLRKERAVKEAGFGVRHMMSARGRRGEQFAPSDAEAQTLSQYDQQIENALKSKARFISELPIVEWEVERRKAVIDGRPIPPKPEKMVETIVRDAVLPAAA